MDNPKIKELTDKIRTEIPQETLSREQVKEITEKINQYLTGIEELTFEEPEEEKKLYQELGISQDKEKKKVVQEVKRLAQLKGVKVDFKEKTEGNIFLPLDQKDKENNFSPNLIFWNLAQELSAIGGGKATKTPDFWKQLEQESIWVKENLNSEYQEEYNQLLTPSTFPHEKLDISQILTVNELENATASNGFSVNSQLIDKAWEIVKEKSLELGFKATINYQLPDYNIMINYASDNPNVKEIENLISTTPLQLEIEYLKAEQEKLPTSENFEKLKEQNRLLTYHLESAVNEEKFKDIMKRVENAK